MTEESPCYSLVLGNSSVFPKDLGLSKSHGRQVSEELKTAVMVPFIWEAPKGTCPKGTLEFSLEFLKFIGISLECHSNSTTSFLEV